MKYLFFVIFLFFTIVSNSQMQVYTITNQINGSGGLNIGPDGMLYIADFGKSLDKSNGTKVWKLDYKHGGQPILFASGLLGASGNDFDSKGNLFQSNIALGKVSEITSSGKVIDFVSTGISCNVGVNIDSDDNIYVCNCCSTFKNTIRKITPQGKSSQFASSNLFACPNGITRDSENNIYVSNFGNGNVLRIKPNGIVSLVKIIPGGSNGHIIYSKIENVLYVASHGSNKIYRLTLDGELSIIAGTGIRGNKDGLAKNATFSRPNGLALSQTGDTLFINSSIPTTDVGGRPLNPSVIRMITGLRLTNSTIDRIDAAQFKVNYDSGRISLIINTDNMLNQRFNISVLTLSGKTVVNKKVTFKRSMNEILLDVNLLNGMYIVNVKGEKISPTSYKILVNN